MKYKHIALIIIAAFAGLAVASASAPPPHSA